MGFVFQTDGWATTNPKSEAGSSFQFVSPDKSFCCQTALYAMARKSSGTFICMIGWCRIESAGSCRLVRLSRWNTILCWLHMIPMPLTPIYVCQIQLIMDGPPLTHATHNTSIHRFVVSGMLRHEVYIGTKMQRPMPFDSTPPAME